MYIRRDEGDPCSAMKKKTQHRRREKKFQYILQTRSVSSFFSLLFCPFYRIFHFHLKRSPNYYT
jgi:hypothetical protein